MDPVCPTISNERLYVTTKSPPAAKLTKKWSLRSIPAPASLQTTSFPESEASMTRNDAASISSMTERLHTCLYRKLHVSSILLSMSFRKKVQNIRPSLRAIRILWQEEFSFKIQTICAFVIVVLSYLLNVSKIEFLILVLTIGAVLAVEALNTALEELCDHVTPEEHPKIGKVKDLGSGASLLIGIVA